MKPFEFAIASIVDANTGHGLEGKYLSVDYASEIHRSREIRSKSVLALVASIKHRIGQVISNYRVRAYNRRAINVISNLSDRLLKDIGIERYEIAQVRAGLTTLEELDASRASRRSSQIDTVQVLHSSGLVDKEIRKLEAINQDSYAQARWA